MKCKNKNMYLEIRKNGLLLIFMLAYTLGNAQIEYVSDFHKKNAGKTFFSDHKITFGTESEKDFRTDFKGGETIYVIRYLKENIDAMKQYYLEFGEKGELDKEKIINFDMIAVPEKQDQKVMNVWQFALVPKLGEATNDELLSVIRPVGRLKRQSDSVTTYFIRKYSSDQGNFTVKINATENYNKIFDDIVNIRSNFIEIPKAGMVDASAVASVKKEIASLSKSDTRYANITVTKVILVSKAWTLETFRNSSQIRSRSLNTVYAICKDEKGKCFLFKGNLYQKKEGSTYNSGTFNLSSDFDFKNAKGKYFETDGDFRFYINCNKVK